MEYKLVPHTSPLQDTMEALQSQGLLLVASGPDGKPNAMTIGWGMTGVIWRRPVFTVLVRESRYTHDLMNQADSFTICVPTPEMQQAVTFCGEHSGRDYDKFQECGFVPLASECVSAPGIDGSRLIYECRIVHAHDFNGNNLAEDLVHAFYEDGDFQRMYVGEILAVKALNGS